MLKDFIRRQKNLKEGHARVKEGDKIKSILTEKVYVVKTIRDWIAVLESLDGSSQVWTERDNLKIFYQKVDSEKNPKDLTLSPATKKLPPPVYAAVDFL